MERKIGEIFTCDGKTYQVVKGITCDGCCILHDHCFSIRESLGPCVDANRTDKTGIIFKEINNMEIKNNKLIIEIPEGMEIDIKNSNLAKGIVKFKKKDITYEDVEYTLKLGKNCKSIIINESNASKLVALSRLMNIAKYYNEDWKPGWDNLNEHKYFITCEDGIYKVSYCWMSNCNNIFFKNREDVQAVIDNPNFRDILNKIYKD